MVFSRRFLPYFIAQCLGALNDNVYKNVLILMVAYTSAEQLPMSIDLFVNIAAAVFILPFLLFSAYAGYLADSKDKAWLIRRIKLVELVLMSGAALAIMNQSYLSMLLLLFLMGTQSAYFGPVKYALLPQVLTPAELVRGNAWVEVSTFLAILCGTLGAGIIVSSDYATTVSAILVVVLAIFGVVAAWGVPSLPPALSKDISMHKGNWQVLNCAYQNQQIWAAIIGISWFWFLGATYLTQFPNFTRIFLFSEPSVVSVLLALFSLGIALGSLTSVRLSKGKVELGVVPLGLLGLTLFGIDFALAVPSSSDMVFSASHFIADSGHYRLMFDLFMVGVSAGIYIVPLYSFIQSNAQVNERARVIAANNILNALFMISSALLAMLLLQVLMWQITELFMLLAFSNLLVFIFICVRKSFFRRAVIHFWLKKFQRE
ncbi:MFS transporter [Shewanella sp. VB17]|uniref:MFS transporter n=1 Tax=Shewanella sp. VB17 TaxID=2739432 RepID=UPI001566A426|nr:MFS transporter [Shewanella sp. VB17]NRD71691.1 MFS transporter [Shewanella sp. VB17]